KTYYVKRFRIETSTVGKKFSFIPETKNSRMEAVSTHPVPMATVSFKRSLRGEKETEKLLLSEFIDVKGWKAMGNKLSYFKIYDVKVPKLEEMEQEEKPKAKKVTTKREPVTLPTELKELAEEAAKVSGAQLDTLEAVEELSDDGSAIKVLKKKKQLDLF